MSTSVHSKAPSRSGKAKEVEGSLLELERSREELARREVELGESRSVSSSLRLPTGSKGLKTSEDTKSLKSAVDNLLVGKLSRLQVTGDGHCADSRTSVATHQSYGGDSLPTVALVLLVWKVSTVTSSSCLEGVLLV